MNFQVNGIVEVIQRISHVFSELFHCRLAVSSHSRRASSPGENNREAEGRPSVLSAPEPGPTLRSQETARVLGPAAGIASRHTPTAPREIAGVIVVHTVEAVSIHGHPGVKRGLP